MEPELPSEPGALACEAAGASGDSARCWEPAGGDEKVTVHFPVSSSRSSLSRLKFANLVRTACARPTSASDRGAPRPTPSPAAAAGRRLGMEESSMFPNVVSKIQTASNK